MICFGTNSIVYNTASNLITDSNKSAMIWSNSQRKSMLEKIVSNVIVLNNQALFYVSND